MIEGFLEELARIGNAHGRMSQKCGRTFVSSRFVHVLLPILQRTCGPRRRFLEQFIRNVIALAQYATSYTRSWAANCRLERMRLNGENDRLRQEMTLLTEEVRLKDARLKRVESQKRPHYLPTERITILELRAARAWSARQTARTFLRTAATMPPG